MLQRNIGLILALAIVAVAFLRRRNTADSTSHSTWWSKLASAVAVVAAILIVMNPEFLALGILGDTAFFDLLVLALSLQLQGIGTQLWQEASAAVCGVVRWLLAPRPTFAMFLLIFAPIGSAVTSMQKIAERILSDSSNCLV
jgi:hypothetical protein